MKALKKVLSVALVVGMICALFAACAKTQQEATFEIYTKDGDGAVLFDFYVDSGESERFANKDMNNAAKATVDKIISLGINKDDVSYTTQANAGNRNLMTGFMDESDCAASGIPYNKEEYLEKRQSTQTNLIKIRIKFSSIEDYNDKMGKIINMYDGQQIAAGDYNKDTKAIDLVDYTATEGQKEAATFTANNDGTYKFSVPVASYAKALDNLTVFVWTNKDLYTPDQAVVEGGGYSGNTAEFFSLSGKVGSGELAKADLVAAKPEEGGLLASTSMFDVAGTPLDEAPSDKPLDPPTTPAGNSNNSTNNNTSSNKTSSNSNNAKTGDSSVVGIAIAMAVVAMGGAVITIKKRAR